MEDSPAKQRKAEEKKLSRFTASEESFGYREFRFASWYVSHRILLGKIGAGALIFFCVLTIGYSLWGWGSYFFAGYFEDRALYANQPYEFINYTALKPRYAAQPLSVVRPRVFDEGNNRYDMFTEVRNPNDNWLALVLYRYQFGGEVSETAAMTILPNQLQILPALGIDRPVYPVGTELQILQTRWRRVDPHTIADTTLYVDDRINFRFDNVVFARRTGTTALSDSLTFTLTNNTSFSFWQPEFHVILFQGSEVVGVRTVTVEQFMAGEAREIDLRFSGDPVNITAIDIVPNINIFDASVFMDPPTS